MPESTPPVRDYPIGHAPQSKVEWPLTLDSTDTNGGNALVPLNGNPIVQGVGFVGDGLYTKLMNASPPDWLVPAGEPLSAFVKVRKTWEAIYGSEIVFSLAHATLDRPKLELAVHDDPTNLGQAQYVLRMWNGAAGTPAPLYLGRASWRFEFRMPELLRDMLTVPQGLCFLDADTLLFTADEGGTSSTILYRVDLVTGEYTGRARSNTLLNCNCIATDQSGDVWGVAWPTSGPVRIFKIDLATSFATGVITEASNWVVTGDAIGPASIAFVTVAGVEYVLLTEFGHTAAPRSFVFLRSKMTAPADAVADRVLKFVVGYNLQGFAQRPSDGMLYASRSLDVIDRYDIAAIIFAGVDNTTPAPVTVHAAPAQRCEGLAFHPGTGRLWIGTQARQINATRDTWSHCALWSCDVDAVGEWNSFMFDYADGVCYIRCNGRLMLRHVATSVGVTERIVVGAAVGSNMTTRLRVLYLGTVNALAFSNTPFTAAQLAALEST